MGQQVSCKISNFQSLGSEVTENYKFVKTIRNK